MYNRQLSDHAVVAFVGMPHEKAKHRQQPIPSFICKHPEFACHVECLVKEARLEELPHFSRLAKHKQILRQAARHTRAKLLTKQPKDSNSLCMLFGTMAKVITCQNKQSAHDLIARSSVASQHLVVHDGVVAPRSACEFGVAFRRAKSSFFEGLINEASNHVEGIRRRKGLSNLFRHARLWKNLEPKMFLYCLVDQAGNMLLEPHCQADCLASHWGPIFEGIAPHPHAIDKFVKDHVKPWKFRGSPPSSRTFVRLLQNSVDSAPGIDGLPYSAWAANPNLSAMTLHPLAGEILCCRIAPPLAFNVVLGAFLPKGEEGEVLGARPPEATRPLGMRNTDSKIVAGAFNSCIRHDISSCACSIQKGFLAGRQYGENVIDLDAHARICSIKRLPLSAMVGYDMCAAFASLFQHWLFAVVNALGFPLGFQSLTEMLYFLSATFFHVAGQYLFLYWNLCGIMQGCPLSGSLYAASLDPGARAFKKVDARTGGLTRMCADDIGSSIPDLSALVLYKKVFGVLSRLAGQTLKPSKMFIIPVSFVSWDRTHKLFRDWIHLHVPAWDSIKVVSSAVYLGVAMGPTAGSKMFTSTLDKWMSRSRLIGLAGTPASTTIRAYNIHAVSCLGYLCQFGLLPQHALMMEPAIVSSLLKVPFRALGTMGPHVLDHIGLPSVKKLSWLNLSCFIRAACKTFGGWQHWIEDIRGAAMSYLNVDQLHAWQFKTPEWDTYPLVMMYSLVVGKNAFEFLSPKPMCADSYDLSFLPPRPPLLSSFSFSPPLVASLLSLPSSLPPAFSSLQKALYSAIVKAEVASLTLSSPQFRNIKELRDLAHKLTSRAEVTSNLASSIPPTAFGDSLFIRGSNMSFSSLHLLSAQADDSVIGKEKSDPVCQQTDACALGGANHILCSMTYDAHGSTHHLQKDRVVGADACLHPTSLNSEKGSLSASLPALESGVVSTGSFSSSLDFDPSHVVHGVDSAIDWEMPARPRDMVHDSCPVDPHCEHDLVKHSCVDRQARFEFCPRSILKVKQRSSKLHDGKTSNDKIDDSAEQLERQRNLFLAWSYCVSPVVSHVSILWPIVFLSRTAGFASRHKFGDSFMAALLDFDWCGLQFALKHRVRKAVAFNITRSLLNTWVTSSRFKHDDQHNAKHCKFGCMSFGCSLVSKCNDKDMPAADALSHYARCPILWAILRCAFKHAAHRLCMGPARLGITLDTTCLFVVSCAVNLYHNIRHATILDWEELIKFSNDQLQAHVLACQKPTICWKIDYEAVANAMTQFSN
jgi:hypothetical protein